MAQAAIIDVQGMETVKKYCFYDSVGHTPKKSWTRGEKGVSSQELRSYFLRDEHQRENKPTGGHIQDDVKQVGGKRRAVNCPGAWLTQLDIRVSKLTCQAGPNESEKW